MIKKIIKVNEFLIKVSKSELSKSILKTIKNIFILNMIFIKVAFFFKYQKMSFTYVMINLYKLNRMIDKRKKLLISKLIQKKKINWVLFKCYKNFIIIIIIIIDYTSTDTFTYKIMRCFYHTRDSSINFFTNERCFDDRLSAEKSLRCVNWRDTVLSLREQNSTLLIVVRNSMFVEISLSLLPDEIDR